MANWDTFVPLFIVGYWKFIIYYYFYMVGWAVKTQQSM